MSDEEDTADPTRKFSRRDRFKDRLARTKTKLTKKEKDSATAVDDFLATGRTSISTGRPSVSDSLSPSLTSDRPPTTQSQYHDAHETQYSSDFVPPPQPSPRRIVVPKIDVSTSQRYPAAQPLQPDNDHPESSLLRPDYQSRSQSSSSLAKGRGRARGLSVQFVDRPPVVIGEGGDEAEAPPIEVGRAKVRARSASPFRNNGPPSAGSKIWNKSPLQYIPRPGQWSPKQPPQPSQPPPNTTPQSGSMPSPGLKRVQTGMIGNSPSPLLESRQAMDKEFEMSLGISPVTTATPSSTAASPIEPPILHAPKPIRPPVPVPDVRESPILHELKSQYGTKSLRNKFEKGEGRALRQKDHNSEPSPNSGDAEESFAPPPGPSPGRRPPDEEFAPPPGPPPPRKMQAANGYQQQTWMPPAANLPSHQASLRQPSPGHPTNGARQAQMPPPPPHVGPNTHFAAPPHPPPSRRAPDEDYTGWVPDSTQSNAVSIPQSAGSAFPGVNPSGKLAPFPGMDEDEEAKPEKTKRRWFRRGS